MAVLIPSMRAVRALAIIAITASIATVAAGGAESAPSSQRAVLARGRYLVAFGACNDCHTPGWHESDGKVPTARWMTGSTIGFRGAWGTSYPANVRLEFQVMPEDQWVIVVRTRGGHPPMLWHDLRMLTDADRHAIFRFIRSLGPAGVPAPASLPPWQTPATPFVDASVHQP